MHQFMYDNFFEILLFGITCIQQQYRFSVITVYFEISGFSPFRIINKFQLSNFYHIALLFASSIDKYDFLIVSLMEYPNF